MMSTQPNTESNHSSEQSSRHLRVLDNRIIIHGHNLKIILYLFLSIGSVECTSDNMKIIISESFLFEQGYSYENVFVNDEYCRPEVSEYGQVVFLFSLNDCGTVRKVCVIRHKDALYPNLSLFRNHPCIVQDAKDID